ncbi:protein cordon-bleu isoform X2 [Rhinatrema bivittatum]|uniref:protein cordon-bleu isoform X2 n=1 Tax=Rhinatrema bivittatum TaxID=194408 RepID=UPI00112EBD61|nr:protein cordon-bleu isoform X2 [Rhinatrema bivittatum]
MEPPARRKMKGRAPPPPVPPAALTVEREEERALEPVGKAAQQSLTDVKENVLHGTVEVTIVLPGGAEKKTTVQGSKAVMDQLVDLCSQYHLNPAHHTLELKSKGSQQPLSYKPNTLIGMLDVDTVILKEKVPEGKTRKPPPKIPAVSVRLVVNFQRTQKTVVRVSPLVPLRDILPVICDKCEFQREHVVLLRDELSRERLPLSETLNELGIKELYAWNSRKETYRSSSVSSDSTERAKKGLLGFFRINKRSSKVEERSVGMDSDHGDDEIFKAAPAGGSNLEEISTAPNSPTVNSRTFALGPSLSLNNISVVAMRPEMKKRRAPPPPITTSCVPNTRRSAEEEEAVRILKTSINKLQKKKRRAPAPPAPVVPNPAEEKEEKRKSSIGDGRQVPQKPPRGTTRGPPLLVIPPPPPYPPPPDRDIVDPPVFQSEADLAEPAELLLKSKFQGASSNSVCTEASTAVGLPMVEEIASMSTWLASEDITEDSGVVSSPSDTVSLDLQNDSVKAKDKPFWGREDSVDLTYTAELCPIRSISCNSDDSWTTHQSKDGDLTLVKNGDEDLFITAQFQHTLAELDEDSGDEADVDCKTQSYSESSQTAEISSPYEYDAESDEDIAIAVPVPVTIIDEVCEDHSCSPAGNTEDISIARDNTEETSRNHAHVANFTNTNNNNADIFVEASVDHRSFFKERNPTCQSTEAKFTSEALSQSEGALEIYASPFSSKKENKAATSYHTYENGVNPNEEKSHAVFITEIKVAQANTECFAKSEDKQRSQNRRKEDSETGHKANENGVHLGAEPISPTLWWPQVHNTSPSYEPRVGLTTFKVVPPKPGVKQYDRGVSLSASAIKIDELGNLISPYTSNNKKDTSDVVADNETEGSLIRRAKEFWRSTSVDKQTEDATEQASKNSLATISSKPYNQETEIKSDFLPNRKVVPSHTNAYQARERHSEYEESKPPLLVTLPQVKPYTAPSINKGRGDLSFLKPYRRTSSQYVASAIAKCISPTESKPNVEAFSKEDNKYDDTKLKFESEFKNKKSIILSNHSAGEMQQDKTNDSYQDFNNCQNKEWNTLVLSNYRGKENNGAIETSNEAHLASISERNVNVHLPKSSYREINRIEDYGLTGRQNMVDKRSCSVSAEKCEKVGDASSQSNLRSPIPSKSSTLPWLFPNSAQHYSNNGESTLPKHSPVFNSTPLFDQVLSEKGDKPDILPTITKMEPDIISDKGIFGPKKKFRPVVQKPVQKDTSLHGVLMEAIQSGEGKDRLRKIQNPESMSDGSQKKLSFIETETERSALLSAIRAHNGSSRLRKISSSASEELQHIRNSESLVQGDEMAQTKQLHMLLPPPPPPPPPSVSYRAPKHSVTPRSEPVNAREALMEAIRSGTGAASLKKVSVSMNTV